MTDSKKIIFRGCLFWGGVSCVMALCLLISPFRLMFNVTNSVPHTLFLVHTTSLPKKGEYGLVDHPQFDRFLIKKVAGLEGDVVDTNSSQILLNNQIVGALKERTSTGGKLTPIASQFIPAGKFFVLGESANSYDSRYANFGLVDHSQVRGTAWPLF